MLLLLLPKRIRLAKMKGISTMPTQVQRLLLLAPWTSRECLCRPLVLSSSGLPAQPSQSQSCSSRLTVATQLLIQCHQVAALSPRAHPWQHP